jgi:3-isopropylmalate/(R)-2-methylmalate dehydratase small subunit
MEKFTALTTAAVPIARANVNTDLILPARYLQKPRSAPFGDYLFHDLRRLPDGSFDPAFALNQAPYQGAKIMAGLRNFACGSSREHAVWALFDHGFRCVIAPSFSDIFYSNSLKNGLLPVVLDEARVNTIVAALQAAPGTAMTVNLDACTVTGPDGETDSFEIAGFARQCLLQGQDEIDYTRSLEARIAEYERALAA